MSLSEFSDDELRGELLDRELKRKETRKQLPPPPRTLHNTNWQMVYAAAHRYIQTIATGMGHWDDFSEEVFRTTLEAIYGTEVFEWIRKAEAIRRGED